MTTTVERFEDKYIPVTESGCWLWIGAIGSTGYGNFKNGNRTVKAHRFSYELAKGKIPDGLHLDHLCRVSCCVNPNHLEPVTPKENIRRGIGVGKVIGEIWKLENLSKTHCPHGHPYYGKNLYLTPAGKRQCRKCKCANQKKYLLNKK